MKFSKVRVNHRFICKWDHKEMLQLVNIINSPAQVSNQTQIGQHCVNYFLNYSLVHEVVLLQPFNSLI